MMSTGRLPSFASATVAVHSPPSFTFTGVPLVPPPSSTGRPPSMVGKDPFEPPLDVVDWADASKTETDGFAAVSEEHDTDKKPTADATAPTAVASRDIRSPERRSTCLPPGDAEAFGVIFNYLTYFINPIHG